MKKQFPLFLCFLICLSLLGCAGSRQPMTKEELREEITRISPEEVLSQYGKTLPLEIIDEYQPKEDEHEPKTYTRKRYDLFAPLDPKIKPVRPTEKPYVPEKPEEKAIAEDKKEPVEKHEETAVVLKPSTEIPEKAEEKIMPEKPIKAEEPVKTVKEPSYPPPEHLALFDIWDGECLVYQLTWNSIRIGKGLLACKQVENAYGNVYHITGMTIPEGRIGNMSMGLHRMDAFIDKKTLQPHFYYHYSKSGNKEDILEIHFDWTQNKYTSRFRKFENGKVYNDKKETSDIADTAHDGISIFYIVRTLDLDNNSYFSIPLAFREMWDLTIQTAGRRTENIASMGNREVYVLKPTAQGDEGFFTRGPMNLWLTADEKRLPVYLEGRVALGRARMSIIGEVQLSEGEQLDSGKIAEILSRFN